MNESDNEIKVWRFERCKVAEIVSRTRPHTADDWVLVNVRLYERNGGELCETLC